MQFFRGTDALVASAITRKDPFLTVQAHSNIDSIIANVIDKDPRLAAFVKDRTYQSSRGPGMRGLIAGSSYNVTLIYFDDLPNSIDDVVVDSGTWTPTEFVKSIKGAPDQACVVTKNVNDTFKRIQDDTDNVCNSVPGLQGTRMEAFKNVLSHGWYVVRVSFDYGMPLQRLRQLEEAAQQKAGMMLSKFGDGTVPKYIKVFLAFSYLQICCSYDTVTDKCIRENRRDDIRNPASLTPYGPLVQNLGVSTGIAEAFQLLMDKIGVDGKVVHGIIGDYDDAVSHDWNLVELGGRWYHIDCSFGMDSPEVCAQRFMKTDAEMLAWYRWDRDPAKYPQANGSYYTIDRTCDYIEDNESDLLAAGVDRRYLLPTIML